MTRRMMAAAGLAVLAVFAVVPTPAQATQAGPAQAAPAPAAPAPAQAQPAQAPDAAGHWTGAVETPGQALDITVDIKRSAPPGWVGTISIPAQNLTAFPLSSIQVQGKSVAFSMAGIPGSPTFTAQLSDDGTTLTGEFSQGEGRLPFKLTRAGDAVITPIPKSTPITKELEGSWSGALEISERKLRLTLKLANGADGATGSIVSVDQGDAEIAVATITQTGSHLELALPNIAGTYSADLKDGRLVGEWKQGGRTSPLEFVRTP